MDEQFLYTLIFVYEQDKVLVVKRKKDPWIHLYNGLGGKRQKGETAFDCIKRELYEESGIILKNHEIKDCGVVTWNEKGYQNGLHLFKANKPLNYFEKGLDTREGMLEVVPLAFMIDKHNFSIAQNIPFFIENMLNHEQRFEYYCLFENNQLVSVTTNKL